MHPQRKFYSPLQPTPLYEMVRMPRATTEMNYYQVFNLAFKVKGKESLGQVLGHMIAFMHLGKNKVRSQVFCPQILNKVQHSAHVPIYSQSKNLHF